MRATARMKSGVVVQMRVPPADVMTCIDLAEKAGLYTDGMSLAMVVRAALSGLCEHARKRGHAPIREGFEFDRMVRPFLRASHGAKVMVASRLEREAEREPIPDIMPARRATDLRLTDAEMDRLREINELIVRSAVEEGKTVDQWGVEHPDLYEEFKALDARI